MENTLDLRSKPSTDKLIGTGLGIPAKAKITANEAHEILSSFKSANSKSPYHN
jgi:hypothetical protein